jgi:osmotically inducible protein OsmC
MLSPTPTAEIFEALALPLRGRRALGRSSCWSRPGNGRLDALPDQATLAIQKRESQLVAVAQVQQRTAQVHRRDPSCVGDVGQRVCVEYEEVGALAGFHSVVRSVRPPAERRLAQEDCAMQVLYTAEATATGGRKGHIRSSGGVPDTPLALPKELGGPGGNATNPEQLFVAGYAAFFENAPMRVARERKAPTGTCPSQPGSASGGRRAAIFRLAVELEVSVPGRDRVEVEELARIAHEEVCPYSPATRGNVELGIRVV